MRLMLNQSPGVVSGLWHGCCSGTQQKACLMGQAENLIARCQFFVNSMHWAISFITRLAALL